MHVARSLSAVVLLALQSLCACGAAATDTVEVFVASSSTDAATGDGFSVDQPLNSVHAARDVARSIVSQKLGVDVVIQLLPGLHHVGSQALQLGAQDGGRDGGTVTWRSVDAGQPAIIGAPIRVTRWKPHPTIRGAFSAPLPQNITKGSALRQLWVNGARADRPRIYGNGTQQGDNKMGRCLNLTNATNTPMYPEGSQYDFRFQELGPHAPSKWPNPSK